MLNNRTNTKPLVSILLPVLGTNKAHRQCFDALLNQQEKNFEIIVLSTESHKISTSQDRRIVEIKLTDSESSSFLKTLIKGLQSARGRNIVWMNPKHIPADSHWLSSLTAPLESNPVVGAVTCTSYKSSCKDRGLGSFLGRAVNSKLMPEPGKSSREIDLLPMECDAMRTDMLEELCLEKIPDMPADAERVEISLRIKKSGWSILFQPAARTHSSSQITEPRAGALLKKGLDYGEIDALMGKKWRIDWLHGRFFFAALLSLLLIPLAYFRLPYGIIGAGLFFGWGWFYGFRVPFVPFELPLALVNLGVYIFIILMVRDDWAPSIFSPEKWHPAIIRQWIFVLSIPASYMLLTLASAFRNALKGVVCFKGVIYLPALIILSVIWHILLALGYARGAFLQRR